MPAFPGRSSGKQQFTELFPVQSVVWTELAGGASSAHDLCIAAPTGSGKTLAYALPVVNGLARYVCNLCSLEQSALCGVAMHVQGIPLLPLAPYTQLSVTFPSTAAGGHRAAVAAVQAVCCVHSWCSPHVTWLPRCTT